MDTSWIYLLWGHWSFKYASLAYRMLAPSVDIQKCSLNGSGSLGKSPEWYPGRIWEISSVHRGGRMETLTDLFWAPGLLCVSKATAQGEATVLCIPQKLRDILYKGAVCFSGGVYSHPQWCFLHLRKSEPDPVTAQRPCTTMPCCSHKIHKVLRSRKSSFSLFISRAMIFWSQRNVQKMSVGYSALISWVEHSDRVRGGKLCVLASQTKWTCCFLLTFHSRLQVTSDHPVKFPVDFTLEPVSIEKHSQVHWGLLKVVLTIFKRTWLKFLPSQMFFFFICS